MTGSDTEIYAKACGTALHLALDRPGDTSRGQRGIAWSDSAKATAPSQVEALGAVPRAVPRRALWVRIPGGTGRVARFDFDWAAGVETLRLQCNWWSCPTHQLHWRSCGWDVDTLMKWAGRLDVERLESLVRRSPRRGTTNGDGHCCIAPPKRTRWQR